MDKKKLKKTTDEIEFVIGVVLLAVMLGAATINVVARYVLDHSMNWADELCRFGLIWVSFVSMSAAVTSGNHLYVDLLTGITDKHPRFAYIIEVLAGIIWIGIGIFLGYWGFKSVMRVTEMTQTLYVSMKVIYFSIPFGCAFMVFRVAQKLVLDFKATFKNEKGGEEQ